MPQFSRPNADTLIGNYVDEGAGTTNIFNSIDESTASSTDYVESPTVPADEVYVCKLSTVPDPLSSTNHTVNYRFGKDAAAGDQVDMTIEIRQGYTNEGAQGTLIATITETDISDTPTDNSYTLSGGEADAITDYSDLYARILFNTP